MAKTKANKKGKTSVPKAKEEFTPKVAAAFAVLAVVRRRFVIAYCSAARGNATLAAQMSGIKSSYSGQACWGSMQLRRADVRGAVQAWQEAYAMSAAEITERMTDLALVNPGPFFEVNKDGKLAVRDKMDPREWEAHKHWVKKILVDDKGNVIELELHDSQSALRDLAKINKMYSDAPIFGYHLYLSQLPDAELLRQLTEAREEEMNQQPRLPPGEPVIVIAAPVSVPLALPLTPPVQPPAPVESIELVPVPVVVQSTRVKTPPTPSYKPR